MSPPAHIVQMAFSNGQAPCATELRMVRMLKAMYIMLDQTLDGFTNSLSAAERMNAACSLVSRTVATLGSWRASAAVVALLQPAKDITDLFSCRSIKNGCVGQASLARQCKVVYGTAVSCVFEHNHDERKLVTCKSHATHVCCA